MATKKVSSKLGTRTKARKSPVVRRKSSKTTVSIRGKTRVGARSKTSSKAKFVRSKKAIISRTTAKRSPTAKKRSAPSRKASAGRSQSLKNEEVKSNKGIGVRGRAKSQGSKLQGRSKKGSPQISNRGLGSNQYNKSSENMPSKANRKSKDERDFETSKGHNARENVRKNSSKEIQKNPRNPKQDQKFSSDEESNENESGFEREGYGKKSQVKNKEQQSKSEINLTLGEKAYDKEYQNRSNLESQAKSKKSQKNKSKSSGRISDQGAQGDKEHQHDDTYPEEEYENLKNVR